MADRLRHRRVPSARPVVRPARWFWPTARCVGPGIGARGASVGEVCFNTSITGYQEIDRPVHWPDHHFHISARG